MIDCIAANVAPCEPETYALSSWLSYLLLPHCSKVDYLFKVFFVMVPIHMV